MAGLPTIKQSQMDDRQKQVYDVIASGPRGNVRGPLAIWLHRVDLADKAQALGNIVGTTHPWRHGYQN